MHDRRFDVVGIGNAIVDVISHADDGFVTRHHLNKGAMTLVDEARAESLYRDMGPGIESSGGSAANTMAGVASFGGRAAYIGKVRDDTLGTVFAHDIRATGVAYDVPPGAEGPPTARCLIFVTPDAQRTMNTFLGISALLSPDDVDEDLVAAASVTYCEGYLWDVEVAKEAMRKAMRVAHAAGNRVAFALSDGFCVDRHRAEFLELVEGAVDVVFANEDEICSLYRVDSFEAALDRVRGSCELACLTRSEKGSVLVTADEEHVVPAHPVARVVDSTGAGDLYASGVLYGLTAGLDLPTCGRLGSLAEVISHLGARPQQPLRELAGDLSAASAPAPAAPTPS
jgi:sugar/nucleoside kinase (ribokinase family)